MLFDTLVQVGWSNNKMVINRICPGHNFYIYAWILKYFGTVVFLEE